MKSGAFAVAIVVAVSLSFLGPFAAYGADVAAGQQLYNSKCKGCHGATGMADGPLVKAMKLELNPFYGEDGKLQKSDEELRQLTLEGVNKMPPFKGKLSDEDMDNIMAFLHSLEP